MICSLSGNIKYIFATSLLNSFLSTSCFQIDDTFIIKVLIQEQIKTKNFSWKFSSKKDLSLINPDDKTLLLNAKNSKLIIEGKDGTLYIDNNPLPTQSMMITSPDDFITFNDKKLPGSFVIGSDEKNFFLINYVPVEEYVTRVVMGEIGRKWGEQAIQAQAIAARTYILEKAVQNRMKKKLYHVTCSTADQSYSSKNISDTLKKYVNQTRGIIISYGNKPIKALYHTCCGGIIPDLIDEVIFVKVHDFPYLDRKTVCTFCTKAPNYKWQSDVMTNVLEKKFTSEFHDLHDLQDVVISQKDQAGIVQRAILQTADKHHETTGHALHALLHPNIKNYCFASEKKNRSIHFNGNGFGHHLGMCQYGMKEMSKRGINFQQILAFYYPETKLVRLWQ